MPIMQFKDSGRAGSTRELSSEQKEAHKALRKWGCGTHWHFGLSEAGLKTCEM